VEALDLSSARIALLHPLRVVNDIVIVTLLQTDGTLPGQTANCNRYQLSTV
jgi:hypothetical protein